MKHQYQDLRYTSFALPVPIYWNHHIIKSVTFPDALTVTSIVPLSTKESWIFFRGMFYFVKMQDARC